MEQNIEVSRADYRALAEFRYQVRRFLRLTEEYAREAGVHPQQHRLLLAIEGMPEGMASSVGNLADRMQLEHHSVVELVDRASARHLVMRRHDVRDRRTVLVSLTARGKQQLRKISLRNRDELRASAPTLVQALQALMQQENKPQRGKKLER